MIKLINWVNLVSIALLVSGCSGGGSASTSTDVAGKAEASSVIRQKVYCFGYEETESKSDKSKSATEWKTVGTKFTTPATSGKSEKTTMSGENSFTNYSLLSDGSRKQISFHTETYQGEISSVEHIQEDETVRIFSLSTFDRVWKSGQKFHTQESSSPVEKKSSNTMSETVEKREGNKTTQISLRVNAEAASLAKFETTRTTVAGVLTETTTLTEPYISPQLSEENQIKSEQTCRYEPVSVD